jgi:hypothetical protein
MRAVQHDLVPHAARYGEAARVHRGECDPTCTPAQCSAHTGRERSGIEPAAHD